MKKSIILILVGVIVTLGLIVFFKYWQAGRPEYRFGNDRAAVIKQIQLLSRLETASFNIDKVIEASTNYGSLKQMLFGDKLLLVAHGKVVAGFDLASMKTQDFEGSGTTITIRLPAPQVFSTIIDNSKTRVFDRSQGFFTKGEVNLESEARQQAELAIYQAACEGGILLEANLNAQKQLEVIFKSAGFQSVAVVTKPGKCE
jgi:hypothetical protein